MSAEAQALARLRAAVLRGDLAQAEHVVTEGLRAHPHSLELRRALAGLHRQGGREAQAEALLRDVLASQPDDAAAAFALAEMCVQHGRLHAAGQALRACFAHGGADADLAIRAIELLADAQRQAEAAAIAEATIAAHPDDVRLHAYAGMLEVQTGEFERARAHYRFALAHEARAVEWNVLQGLTNCQRYADATHPDFALLRDCLARSDLSEKARTSLLFASAKAHDDIGDHARAAHDLRAGNALAHATTAWSRKRWKRAIEARLAAPAFARQLPPADFVPVFIVGMPRSGTTLLARLLARYRRVCNRGELPWLAQLAAQVEVGAGSSRAALERAAATYAMHARQDDAGDAHWFIDKQPLNFRYLDLALALFPNARILTCRRNRRDTALSLWSQLFMEAVQGYAYDFDDIARVMHDGDRLLAHWGKQFAASIREVRYEQLAADPQGVVAEVAAWLG
ncbi:MAG: sulfotransferase, partial [Proteobacteria bacterium]|nr:sulfotransferase [Pseudomonadota bacterium]